MKRITKFIRLDPRSILSIIWDIYYKEEKDCIYAIAKKDLIIINSYLLSGLRTTVDFIDLQLSDMPFYLYHTIKFDLYNVERNTYRNSEGIYLQKTLNNRVYIKIEGEDEKVILSIP